MKNKSNNIMVERETYKKNDKEYFSYFIKGTIRNKQVKIGVTPPDLGGYAVLDIVFGESKQAELVLKPYEIKNDATGEVMTGNSYIVRSVDEDGTVYECAIKPTRKSDKSLLTMLTR